jgi:hypothetical protein
MNIIANSCVGGFIYKNELKEPFQNPFIWSLIDFESMLYLAKNFYSINFNNIRLTDVGKIEDDTWEFHLIIDNNVLVKYVHYKFSMFDKHPTVRGIDVFYDKIWEYIIDKYRERVSRMIRGGIPPTFVFANWFNKRETELDYMKLQKLNELTDSSIICAVDTIYTEFTNIKQLLRRHEQKIWNPGVAHNVYNTFIK